MSPNPSPDPRSSAAPLLLMSVPLIALLHATTQPVATNDLYIYLAMGRWMAEHGAMLDVERFTFLAEGTPFINGTWGWSLLSYALHQLGGLGALALANGLAVAAAVAWIAAAALRGGARSSHAAIGSLYAWMLMLQNVSVRGQTLAYPLFAALLWLCAAPIRPGLALLGGVAIGALWAPLHGSFVAGGLAALALALGRASRAEPWRPAALTALGVGVGACLGPFGPEIFRYVLENSALPSDRAFTEWCAPSPESFEGARFFAAVGLWLGLRGLERGRARAGEGLTLVLFGLLACTGLRFIAWFGLATAPLLALRLSALPATPGGLPRAWVRGALLGLLLLWTALLREAWIRWTPQLTPDTPVAAVEAVRRDAPSGRVLVQPEYGGYVTWCLWPNFLISSDVRTWVFSDEAWGVYIALRDGPPDWEDRLDALGVTHLVLRPGMHGEALLRLAESAPGWRVLPSDGEAVALRRVDPAEEAR